MGLLFAFFLIGLPLIAGVADYMMTTGQYKNADLSSKIGGYTPQVSSASSMRSDTPTPAAAPLAQPAPVTPMHEPPPVV